MFSKISEYVEKCHKLTSLYDFVIFWYNFFITLKQKIFDYVIPSGHQVCVSPTTNHVLPNTWEEPEKFNPYRFRDYAFLNIILRMLHHLFRKSEGST